jgi:hypothetical protein
MNITYIYLIENCYGDHNKIYIGKTKNSREKDHKKKYGFNIDYTIIDQVNSLEYKDWEPLETYWIEQFKQWGFEVVNKRKKGGSGPEFQTNETKKKISNSTKGKNTWRKGKSSPNSGGKGKPKPNSGNRNWSIEHLNKIKLAAKNKNKTFYKNNNWIKAQCKPIIQYDLNSNVIKEWISIKQASETLNINRFSISQCLSLKINQKTAGGFVWKYK